MPDRFRIIAALEVLLTELRETSVEGYSAALKISHRDLMDALLQHTKRFDRIEGELETLRKMIMWRGTPPPGPPE